jgi:hypothetical protein
VEHRCLQIVEVGSALAIGLDVSRVCRDCQVLLEECGLALMQGGVDVPCGRPGADSRLEKRLEKQWRYPYSLLRGREGLKGLPSEHLLLS